jgi:hypothetical protein
MNILWTIAQNVYIISDSNIFSEQNVNDASQYMTGPYDHHRHSSFRFTRNADARMHSYRPLVRTKIFRNAMLFHSDKDSVGRMFFFCEAIGTAATPGLLCQRRVILKMIVEKKMECRLAG